MRMSSGKPVTRSMLVRAESRELVHLPSASLYCPRSDQVDVDLLPRGSSDISSGQLSIAAPVDLVALAGVAVERVDLLTKARVIIAVHALEEAMFTRVVQYLMVPLHCFVHCLVCETYLPIIAVLVARRRVANKLRPPLSN